MTALLIFAAVLLIAVVGMLAMGRVERDRGMGDGR